MFQSKIIAVADVPWTAAPLELAVVIPVLNEAANIAAMVEKLDAVLGNSGWEAIFVDDHSADGTAAIARTIARADRRIRVIERINRRGLASAVIEGVLASAAPIILVMDGDMQHDETIIPSLFLAVANGADLAIGSRYASGGSLGDWDENRASFSRWATRAARAVLPVPITDPMSGFFAVRRDVFEAALPRLSATGFKILLDLVVSAPPALKVVELPYRFRVRNEGASKLDMMVAAEYAELLIDKTIGHILPIRLLKFMGVGLVGLGVHLCALAISLTLGLDFAVAQAMAVLVAMTFNFALNNAFTYRDRRLRGWRLLSGLFSFYIVCLLGALANIGVGSWVHATDHNWWVAGAAGALIGAVWNFAASSVVTWRR